VAGIPDFFAENRPICWSPLCWHDLCFIDQSKDLFHVYYSTIKELDKELVSSKCAGFSITGGGGMREEGVF